MNSNQEKIINCINEINEYRLHGDFDNALLSMKNAEKMLEISGDANLYMNYYNASALLYQETGKLEEAVKCLEKVLEIADFSLNDEIKSATAKTNLASCFIRIKRLEDAKALLESAISAFEGMSPSDVHYSAALAAMGDLSLFSLNYKVAIKYFEMALSEIEMHMGRNNFYNIVSDNLKKAYELSSEKREESLISISEIYFEYFGLPMLKRKFPELINHIACGVFGNNNSFFAIVCDDTVKESDINRLRSTFSSLPGIFMGVSKDNKIDGKNRENIFGIKEFLNTYIGIDHLPEGCDEWQYMSDEALSMVVNGKLFFDKSDFFSNIRKYIKTQQPAYIYFNKMAVLFELMYKAGMSEYGKAVKRNDKITATMEKADFIRNVLKIIIMLNKEYAPYSKELKAFIDEIIDASKGEYIDVMRQLDMLSEDNFTSKALEMIEKINSVILQIIKDYGLVCDGNDNLFAAAEELRALANRAFLADEIIKLEWELLLKADDDCRKKCVSDKDEFCRTRKSMYYLYDMKLLEMIYSDIRNSMMQNRNIINEKFQYIQNGISNSEEIVPDTMKNIIDGIVLCHKEWRQQSADSNCSLMELPFEKIIEADISTYHENTLYLYAKYISEIQKNKENFIDKYLKLVSFFS